MTHRVISILFGLMLLFGAGPVMAQTVILVRHAEKVDASSDPVLSEAGQARATALSQAMRDLPLTHILVTPLRRTALTAAPAAEAHGVTPEPISLEGGTAHIERIVARIGDLPASAVVLVVGHSNTIPAIARALGLTATRDMADCQYDRLIAVNLQTRESAEATYGAASACP